jgi:putative membrane protein
MGWGWHGVGMGVMGMFWILLLVLLVVLAARWALPAWRNKSALAPASDSPLDVLKKRYARGEISADEFARIRREIE